MLARRLAICQSREEPRRKHGKLENLRSELAESELALAPSHLAFAFGYD
jgi:hypothetical protein